MRAVLRAGSLTVALLASLAVMIAASRVLLSRRMPRLEPATIFSASSKEHVLNRLISVTARFIQA